MQFRLIFSALRQCGARPGELCRATIADIDRTTHISTTQRYMHLDDRELADAQDLVE